jgi:hypothetical protein
LLEYLSVIVRVGDIEKAVDLDSRTGAENAKVNVSFVA